MLVNVGDLLGPLVSRMAYNELRIVLLQGLIANLRSSDPSRFEEEFQRISTMIEKAWGEDEKKFVAHMWQAFGVELPPDMKVDLGPDESFDKWLRKQVE